MTDLYRWVQSVSPDATEPPVAERVRLLDVGYPHLNATHVERFRRLAPLIQERCKTFGDVVRMSAFLFWDDEKDTQANE